MMGLLGKKIGMTSIFDEQGRQTPVTVIEVEPSEVLFTKTKEKNGYSALQLGIGERKNVTKNKPKKAFIREIRLRENPAYKKGDFIGIDLFQVGDYLDTTGISKGKGFQGGVKRWHWRGGDKSHGSMHHRAVGSIGASSFPSRVHKGKTMPGHMGCDKKTIQNLKIVKIDKENKLMFVKGSVPGSNNAYLILKEALKKPKKEVKK